MQLQVGEVSTIVISSPEIAKEVMRTHDINFASRPPLIATEVMSYNYTNMSFAPYGDYWRQLRKIYLSELLSTRRVLSFRSLREEETSNLSRWIAKNAGSPINLTESIHLSAYTTTSKVAFGKKSAEQEAFISIVKESMRLAAGFNIADIYPSIKLLSVISGVKPKLVSLRDKAARILGTIINEHLTGFATNTDKPQGHKDIVDVLLKYHEGGEHLDFSLTIENIRALLVEVFGAGSETVATAVDWAMVEMIRNPRIMDKAQDEVREVFNDIGHVDEGRFDKLKYLKSVLKETMRLHPPVPLLLPRQNNEKCEINEYEIPAKTRVIVNAWAIHRDPLSWIDAETFHPERFLDSSIDYKGTQFSYIPFGAGRRMCPGNHFAIANATLQLSTLLYHFDWKLPNGMKPEELDMSEAFGVTVRRKVDLHLIPAVRNPVPVE